MRLCCCLEKVVRRQLFHLMVVSTLPLLSSVRASIACRANSSVMVRLRHKHPESFRLAPATRFHNVDKRLGHACVVKPLAVLHMCVKSLHSGTSLGKHIGQLVSLPMHPAFVVTLLVGLSNVDRNLANAQLAISLGQVCGDPSPCSRSAASWPTPPRHAQASLHRPRPDSRPRQ